MTVSGVIKAYETTSFSAVAVAMSDHWGPTVRWLGYSKNDPANINREPISARWTAVLRALLFLTQQWRPLQGFSFHCLKVNYVRLKFVLACACHLWWIIIDATTALLYAYRSIGRYRAPLALFLDVTWAHTPLPWVTEIDRENERIMREHKI